MGSTQWSCLTQTESTRRLRYNFCFSLFWVFTSLSLSSPVHKQPSLGHLIIIDKIFLPVALSGNTSYSIIKNKIKRSAQDQSNMNFFDSKGSFFIYFFCQRLIRTYETFMLLMMMIIMIIIRRWTFFKLLKYFWNYSRTFINKSGVNAWIKLSCSKSFKKFIDSLLGFRFLHCMLYFASKG